MAGDDYDVAHCVAAVGGPRVALMFLTRGGLPYEQLWAEWLGSAAGLLPAQHVQVRTYCSLERQIQKSTTSLRLGPCEAGCMLHPGHASQRRRLA